MTPLRPMVFSAVGKLLIIIAVVIAIEVIALHFGLHRIVRWVLWSAGIALAVGFIPAAYDLYSHEPFGPRENLSAKRKKLN